MTKTTNPDAPRFCQLDTSPLPRPTGSRRPPMRGAASSPV